MIKQVGKHLQVTCNGGSTPLHVAALRNDPAMVEVLLAAYVQVNVCVLVSWCGSMLTGGWVGESAERAKVEWLCLKCCGMNLPNTLIVFQASQMHCFV
jgi:hypothetical protein